MKLKLNLPDFKPRLTVTTKIAVALCLLIAFLMAAVGTSVSLRDQAILKKAFEERGWNIVHTALPSAGDYITTGNSSMLRNLVNRISDYDNISYVAVMDGRGIFLAHSEENLNGARVSDAVTLNAMAARTEKASALADEQGKAAVLDLFAPIKSSDGATLGYFRLGLDTSGLNKYVRETVAYILINILLAIFAGIFLSSLITRRILHKPLQDLTAATEKLATGDFSYKVPVHNQDELGDLATSFNTMSVHLANLIQSIKSNADDINRSAEQILGRLQTSDRTNLRLSQTFDTLNQYTIEQMDLLKQTLNHSEELAEQSRHAADCVLQILNEVEQTAQTGTDGVSAITSAAADIAESGRSLQDTRNSIRQLSHKFQQFNQAIDNFSDLLSKNTSCTVQAALLAARSGNEELARSAEELHTVSEGVTGMVQDMSGLITEIRGAFNEAEDSLEGDLQRLNGGQTAVDKARQSLEKVLYSLLQSKQIVEEMAATSHRQYSGIDDIKRSQNSIIEEMEKTINRSTGAGNDTKLQTDNLHDMDSLAKKLMRMVDRLNSLSLQFKI